MSNSMENTFAISIDWNGFGWPRDVTTGFGGTRSSGGGGMVWPRAIGYNEMTGESASGCSFLATGPCWLSDGRDRMPSSFNVAV